MAIIQVILLGIALVRVPDVDGISTHAGHAGVSALGVAFAFLSVSFVTASLLAWRYSALPVRIYYTAAAIWIGFFNFFFLAACASWIAYGLIKALRLPWQQQDIAFLFFGLAVAVGVCGLVNSARVRVTRVSVKLPTFRLAGGGGCSVWSQTRIWATCEASDSRSELWRWSRASSLT